MFGNNGDEDAGSSNRAGATGVSQHRGVAAVEPWQFEPAAAEPSFNLAQYWRLLLKHRILIIATFVVSVVIGIAATFLMTPIYTASTTLQIDREAARVLETDDVAPRESMIQGEEFFQTQYGLLRSRSLAQRVVESLGLANSDAFLEAMQVQPPASVNGRPVSAAQRMNAVIGVVQDNLGVKPVRASRLVGVSFDSPDPALSARVANAFAENFIQSNLDRKFESSLYAREFLEERLAQTKAKLEDAERQLVTYATNQQIINVAEGDGENGASQSLAVADLVALNSSLATAESDRIAAEAKWRQASSGQVMSVQEVLGNPAIQRLTETRAQLNASYQQKLSIYRPDFPEMQQLSTQISELDRQIATLANEIRQSIRQEYLTAASRERELQGRVNGLKSDVLDLRSRSIQYNIIQREVDTSRTLYDGLLQRYKEVGVAGGVTTNNISIVDEAEPPSRPSKPNLLLNLVLAIVLGLGLGVLGAFALEALDEAVATPEDVENKLEVPVLGVIPALAKGVVPLEALNEVRSAFAEAYYSLRTALQFSTPDGIPATLFVTSSRPGEGKSTTAFALAHNLARIGKRVLLLDLDLRNPSMHRVLGVSNDHGMSSILSGAATLSEVVQRPEQTSLWFVPCGPLPPNPAELLGGTRIQEFLRDAARDFDTVVIDGPPVLGFADAPLLAATAGGTLFVLESRGTRRGQARGALRRLNTGRARLLGVVLTKFNSKAASYGSYNYAYDYDYGSKPEAKPVKNG